MKRRNTLSILLLTAMLAQLAACGGAAESTDTTAAGAADTTAAETTAPAEYEKPDVDYGGKTFTIASFNFTMNYNISNYTMISHEEESGDVINDAIVQMTRQVEEDLNIKLEMFEMSNDDRNKIDKITTPIYAGEDEIQLAMPLTVGLAKLLAIPSMLTDLGEIPTLDLSHSWWDQNSIEEYNIGGKQYTAVGDICFFAKAAPIVNFFNKQMLEENKLEDPYQLVYDGKWTLDKMIELSTAAARDLNGNQTVDIDDCFGIIGERSGVPYFMVGCGIDYSTRDKDDKIELTFYSERATSVLEKLIPFMRTSNVCMNDSDWKHDVSVFTEVFTPTFMENRALFFSNQLLMALDFRAMQADFGTLPMPKLDESQKEYYSTTNTYWRDNVVVPVTNGDLEMTGHVLDAMGYYSQQLVTPAFIDTTVLGKSVRDDDSANMIQIIYDSMVYDVARLFDWGGVHNMLMKMFDNSNTNLASEYAAIEPNIKAAMEKTMEELLDN
ncbi:MAG: hypothetical protein IJF67_15415 [Clostridia bacterium]|nr:hypothetical protein [Clostridia bacterium]